MQQLEGLLGVLQGVQPFAGLGREQLISLAIFLRPCSAPKGQVIVRQGQHVDTLYLIQQGRQPATLLSLPRCYHVLPCKATVVCKFLTPMRL